MAGLCLAPAAAEAQRDTAVTVIAGPEYAAGETRRLLLGEDYRDLWTLPVRVPVLDLGSYAGGLTVSHRGGGHQTKVLHLRSADGRDYVFRSVNKFPDLLDEPALQNTPVSAIVQDQVSSLHPGGAAVVAPLVHAVGVLAPDPVLFVMPDDPALGEFRQEFAGLLGWVEERPDEVEVEGSDDPRPGFAGYTRITGTERLLERLEESPEHRVDARGYLTARLVDILVGDWDRHYDQWRWARDDRDEVTYWLPIPRDRDYAFVRYDGLVLQLARNAISNITRFGPEIDLGGLTLNAREVDRRFLAGLGLAEWDSITAHVQAALSDSVIAAAVARMPPEYHASQGAELEETLVRRRDDLRRAAREFYRELAYAVEVRGTDEADLALVDRLADGVVEVRLFARGEDGDDPRGQPYYRRVFYAPETHEVRVFLHGDDDRAVVRGTVGSSLTVRVIGGGGDDVLVDSSLVRSGHTRTTLHDARGDNRLVRGPRTAVDTRPYEPPAEEWEISGETARDWGDSHSIAPVLDYRGTDGLIVGGGPVVTRYGFRQWPYAYRIGARARIGLASLNPAVDVFGDFRRPNSRYGHGFRFDATMLENYRFFGLGNDRRIEADEDAYLVRQDRVGLRIYVDRRSPAGVSWAAGSLVSYVNPDVAEASPIGELPRSGNDGFGQVGAWGEMELDRRGEGAFPRRGYRVEATADAFPGVWSATSPFGSVAAAASTYLTPADAVPVTLALRAGAERVWGNFPVHEAAFLGGSRNLRGHSFRRFAGDAAAFGNAELRAPVTRAVLIVRGTLGVLALADAGRVWYEGSSDGGWHTTAGGGAWFEFEVRDSFVGATALYAAGSDGGRFYLSLGAPF